MQPTGRFLFSGVLLMGSPTAQTDVVWNPEIPGFMQHHHRKMKKSELNVVWIIDFKQIIQRNFKNLHIPLYESRRIAKSYNIDPCFFSIFRPKKAGVVISLRKIEIIQHHLARNLPDRPPDRDAGPSYRTPTCVIL